MTSLPKGIWYDAKRNHYRVRIYRNNKRFHLSYHSTYEEALLALTEAKQKAQQRSLKWTPESRQKPTEFKLYFQLH